MMLLRTVVFVACSNKISRLELTNISSKLPVPLKFNVAQREYRKSANNTLLFPAHFILLLKIHHTIITMRTVGYCTITLINTIQPFRTYGKHLQRIVICLFSAPQILKRLNRK